jgi:hypothetical protein
MKECPDCMRPSEDAAVVCRRCGYVWPTGAEQPQRMSAVTPTAAARKLGLAYGLVTGGLLATIYLSGWCWSYSTKEPVHDTCLTVWVLAGILLTCSQIVFIVLAARTKRSDARLIILLVASIVMVMIGLVVFALANMPS